MSDQNTQRGTQYAALVVDDNWYNRDIFRIALETAEYSVTEAEDGVQGISILEKQSFHLMVLDLQMPGLDGRAVLSKVRTMPRHKGMRIVIVTANAHMATDEVDALADFVMYKPIDVMEFSRFLHRVRGTTSSRFVGEG
jgi:CheY-like chemotaxis protein